MHVECRWSSYQTRRQPVEDDHVRWRRHDSTRDPTPARGKASLKRVTALSPVLSRRPTRAGMCRYRRRRRAPRAGRSDAREGLYGALCDLKNLASQEHMTERVSVPGRSGCRLSACCSSRRPSLFVAGMAPAGDGQEPAPERGSEACTGRSPARGATEAEELSSRHSSRSERRGRTSRSTAPNTRRMEEQG